MGQRRQTAFMTTGARSSYGVDYRWLDACLHEELNDQLRKWDGTYDTHDGRKRQRDAMSNNTDILVSHFNPGYKYTSPYGYQT